MCFFHVYLLSSTMKVFYYAKRFGHNAMPSFYHKKYFDRLRAYEKECDQVALNRRLDYYFKVDQAFSLPSQAIAKKDFERKGRTEYFLDLSQFLVYLKDSFSFAYQFGDDTEIKPNPTLIKARSLAQGNANSILFKLNKYRHFRWVEDRVKFADKKDISVWRGGAYKILRRNLVEKLWNHSSCDIGQTNKPKEDVPWQKGFLSIEQQLQNKFIFCPEGNDVATNLKWVMSSNSLCFMLKPTCETWFMEGTLEAGKHYVEIAADYSNLEEVMENYLNNTDAAEKIIREANLYTMQFRDILFEDLLCLKVLERYGERSGQKDILKW